MRRVIRRSPPIRSNYSEYREELREDFEYSCAYCSIMELEAAGLSFEIDHYDPVSNGGAKNDYSNLNYGCEHCNGRKGKGDIVPQPDPVGEPDLHLLRPDIDDFDDHLQVGADLHVVHKTNSGNYTRVMLTLNRATLLHLRRLRRDAHSADAFVANGLRALSLLRPDELPQPWKHRLRELQKSGVKVPETERSLGELFAKSGMMAGDPHADRALLAERRVLAGELEERTGISVRGGARKKT